MGFLFETCLAPREPDQPKASEVNYLRNLAMTLTAKLAPPAVFERKWLAALAKHRSFRVNKNTTWTSYFFGHKVK